MSLTPPQKARHETNAASQGDMDNNMDKRKLRRALLKTRIELDEATRTKWNAAIAHQLLQLLRERPTTTLGVFWPIKNEPDLRQMYEKLAQQGMKLALPLVVAQKAPLVFAAWKPDDEMVEEALGILVPREKTRVALPEILLAPCVGFNTARYRLGYGGGFFDRTLATYVRPLAIGVAYSFQEADFPVDDFDIPLDCIVTEKEILR